MPLPKFWPFGLSVDDAEVATCVQDSPTLAGKLASKYESPSHSRKFPGPRALEPPCPALGVAGHEPER
jgi:hypothetical protein